MGPLQSVRARRRQEPEVGIGADAWAKSSSVAVRGFESKIQDQEKAKDAITAQLPIPCAFLQALFMSAVLGYSELAVRHILEKTRKVLFHIDLQYKSSWKSSIRP
jgi:hypothetical protein